MFEKISKILTELTGSPVSELAVAGVVVVGAISVVVILFAIAWHKSGQIDWDAVEAERKRLEAEE